MKNWVTGTGVMVFLVGASCLDSQSLAIPVAICLIGVVIIALSEKFLY